MELSIDNLNDHIVAARNGNRESIALLFEAFTVELKRIARYLMANERPGHTLQPTALVNELYIRIAKGRPGEWDTSEQFLAYLHTAMSNVLLDYARAKKTLKRGGKDQIRLSVTDADNLMDPNNNATTIDSNIENIELADILFKALAEKYPIHAQVVRCKYYSDDELTNEEIAQLCNLSIDKVKRYDLFARKWMAHYKELMDNTIK